MPQIPVYEGPQVEQTGLPGARQSADGVGALAQAGQANASMLGRAAQGVADLADVMQRKQMRDDEDAALKAITGLQADSSAYSMSLRKSRLGDGAKGAVNDSDVWFAESARKYSDGLGNDRQRALFERKAQDIRARLMDYAGRHELEQTEIARKATMKATIDSTIEAGIVDPAFAPKAERDIVALVARGLAEDGITDPAVLESEARQYTTRLHGNIALNLMEQDPAKAVEYLNGNRKSMDQSSYDKLLDSASKGVAEKDARQFGQDRAARNVPLDVALEEARKKGGEQFGDLWASGVKQAYGEREAAKRQRVDALYDDLQREANRAGSYRGLSQAKIDALNMLEPTRAAHFIRARQAEIENLSSTGSPHATRDNYEVLDEVERRIAAGDITSSDQINQYSPFLTPSTVKTLRGTVQKRGDVSYTDMQRAFVDRLGKPRSQWGDADMASWTAFQEYVASDVREKKRPEDLEQLADRWFMSGYGTKDSALVNDPDTFGSAKAAGRDDFVIQAPEIERPTTERAMAIVNGASLPGLPPVRMSTGPQSTDKFYTDYGLDAQRWLDARGMPYSPELIAAYTIVRANNKPLTTRNVEAVYQYLSRQGQQ